MATAVDETKLNAFIGKMLGDLGGAFSVPTVRLGFGWACSTRCTKGPATAAELAERAGGLHERYVREWALAQAANGYIDYDPDSRAIQPVARAGDGLRRQGQPRLSRRRLRSGRGHDRGRAQGRATASGTAAACAGATRPAACSARSAPSSGRATSTTSSQNWLPALDGVDAKLEAGAKVADVGCGVGFSTLLMAEAYPEQPLRRLRFPRASIDEARRHAESHGLGDRVRFEVSTAKEIAEAGFDLVTMFDCLHDMGDPRGCARAHAQHAEATDGTWMIVEPIAGDTPADNMNPVGRLYYNASTMICVPTSLDQEVGEGLGAQAGEARLTEVISGGGFSQRAARDRGAVQHGARGALRRRRLPAQRGESLVIRSAAGGVSGLQAAM